MNVSVEPGGVRQENEIIAVALFVLVLLYGAGVYIRFSRTTDLQGINLVPLLLMCGLGFVVVLAAFWPLISCLSERLQQSSLDRVVSEAAFATLLVVLQGYHLPRAIGSLLPGALEDQNTNRMSRGGPGGK